MREKQSSILNRLNILFITGIWVSKYNSLFTSYFDKVGQSFEYTIGRHEVQIRKAFYYIRYQ